jgi:hypothetical protein
MGLYAQDNGYLEMFVIPRTLRPVELLKDFSVLNAVPSNAFISLSADLFFITNMADACHCESHEVYLVV